MPSRLRLAGLALLLAAQIGCSTAQIGPKPVAVAAPTVTSTATSSPSIEGVAPAHDSVPSSVQGAQQGSAALQDSGFSGERAYRDVHVLAGDIGSRAAGSPAQIRAAEYLTSQMVEAGLLVDRQAFSFEVFEDRGSSLTVQLPQPPALTPNVMSHSASGTATGELVAVGLAREVDFAPASVRGKIALAERGDLQFSEKVANLTTAGAVGVVIYNNLPGGLRGSLGSPSLVPVVSVSQQEGTELLQLMAQGPVTVDLSVDAALEPRTGANVVGIRPGGQRSVVIGAHYDSVAAGPGANDNASGTAVLLELARATADWHLPFSLRFIAFDAEEIGLLGSAHYVRQLAAAERESIQAMINIDMVGVGDRLSFGGDPRLVERALELSSGIQPNAVRLGGSLGMSSDHASFQSAGIPALFVHRRDDPRYHTADDLPEHVEPAHITTTGQIILRLLADLAEDGLD